MIKRNVYTLALVVCSVLLCQQVDAQSALKVAKPEATLYTDIASYKGTAIAVGKFGSIVTSQNGKDWVQASVPTQTLLTAVTIQSETAAWACGHDATILFSDNLGKSWQLQKQMPELEKPCLDIEFKNEQEGYAIGAYGMFYKTQDGGKTWESKFLGDFLHPDDKAYLEEIKEDDPEAYAEEIQFILPHFNRLLIDGERVYLVGEIGLVAWTDNTEQGWSKLEEFYPGSFFAIGTTKNNEVVVAGLRGNTFIASKEQLEFKQLKMPKSVSINSVLTFNNKLHLLANSGFMFTVENEGVESHQFEGGIGILSAAQLDDQLIIATEKGLITWGDNK